MATRFHIPNLAAPYTPATIRGAWDATGSHVVKALEQVEETATVNSFVTVSIAENNAAAEYDVLCIRAISGPLAAGTIGTGTVNLILGALESSTGADFHWHLHIYVTQGDSDTPRGTLLTDYREAAGVNEWPTTAAGHGLDAAQSLSSVVVSAGDRIVVELGYTSRNTSISSVTGTLWYGVSAQSGELTVGGDETTNKGYIEFSENFLFDTNTARVTQGYLETIIDSDEVPEARITQGYLETIIGADEIPEARITQGYLETIIIDSNEIPEARVTQAYLEIILLPSTVTEKTITFLGGEDSIWVQ